MESAVILHITDWVYVFLFGIAIIAGIVDAIAGGGGLITVPALLLTGLPPMSVLGTNRLQAVIGELTTSFMYISSRQLPVKGIISGLICTSTGAVCGALAVSLIDKEALETLLPVLMVAITLYSVLSGKLKATEASEPKISTTHFMMLCGLLIGFYNGFFGPGTGSFWMLAFVTLLGYTIKQATMATKPLNLTGNFISLILFVFLGQVDYQLGLIMGIGQIIGSVIGSRFVLSYGTRLVRPVFITVTLIMTTKLIYEHVPVGWFI
ncbi:TSUP family transporter [Vibrio salinus]|uniref:TSUP family transporter n=1 Tax=Vibrio salinus TaxID=2899784 RepID=UPI001E404245|nr:TSUP family transporter [Vibrio salinus]MCE0496215.1 TSUP family transporter [Vibrio salinus]